MELIRYDEIGRLAAGLRRFIYRHIPPRCCGETEAAHAGGVHDLFCREVGEKDVKRKVSITLPNTNIAHENRLCQKEAIIFQPLIFGGLC